MISLKDYVESVNEAKFGNPLSLKDGDTLYAIVCTYEAHQFWGIDKRDMKPIKLEIVKVEQASDKKGLFASLKPNKYKIDKIWVSQSKERTTAWNACTWADDSLFLFCAKSLDELQSLMDSEIGEKLEENLKEIAKYADQIAEIQKKIEKLQEENQRLQKGSKLDI